MYAGCISSLPYRPPSCNLHIQTSSHVCSVPAPVSASFIRSLYPPSLYVFLLSSELPDYQLRNSLIVSHLNSFYRRLPSVTVFLTEHAPNPRAAVISVYDTNPVNAFSRRMYEESPKVRVGTVKCAYYMPLEKANEGPARGDEVAIFVLNPRQAMYLARGTLYSRGGICYGMTGPGTCQSVIAGPFCTRQPMYSLGCFGARQFMKITGNEMWFGVPIEQLALLADDVELLLERRPDLKAQMDEPFDQVRVVTQHELDVQKAKGKLITKNK